jgi:hypothetical protein
VPVVIGKTDSLILVADIQRELAMGVGLKSHLNTLAQNEIALSDDLLTKSQKKVGDSIVISLSIKDLFNGRKLI